MQKISSEKIFL